MRKKITYRRKKKNEPAPDSRITNETVAEHRERILAGGRKFKYPIQYAKHKLVINTLLIVLGAVVVLGVISYVQLYQLQNTNSFFYRLTKIVPVPVASVDGAAVRYSDYLMYYRSSEHYLLQYDGVKKNTESGQRQLDYIKRETMNNAIADAYASKIAKQNNISVDDKDIDAIIDQDKNTQDGRISQEAYDASALRILDWSAEEYKLVVRKGLLLHKVAYFVDENATKKQKQAVELAKQPNADFNQIATNLSDEKSKVVSGATGLIKISGSFGGVSAEAAKLQKGQVSGAIKSSTGDGYYIVRLAEKTDTHVNYDFIHVPLTEFKTKLDNLRSSNKINEYIVIPQAEDANTKQK